MRVLYLAGLFFQSGRTLAPYRIGNETAGVRDSIRQTCKMATGSWAVGSLATPALYAASFLVAVASGLIPFVINIELYLIAVAALAHASPVPIIGLVTMGQMTAKFILYLSGRGVRNLQFLRRVRLDKAAAAFERYPRHSLAVVGFSSLVGLPPFYAVSLLAGTLRLPLLQFMVIGTIGRVIRFSAVYLAPGLFHHAR